MRLLNCRERKLEEFGGTKIPAYAILSHTWADGEVLFSDIIDGNQGYTDKPGWYKIQKSCEQAVEHGLNYIWADTVCIDKSSSAELSEAINSMFKWYRNSKVCYAYLCDLPSVKFEESRWFTRGWTLQEMIAPENLRFYDKEWNFRGSKSDLLERLVQITGIPSRILQGGNLRFPSVARKMSWASRRKTTRIEDIAYCLLGIFEISMPLLYGEGSQAFIRLQEEIIKQYDDESLFAWKREDNNIDHTVTFGLLAPSPAVFADSADIFPCLTPDATKTMSGPITVTSRGVRMEVPVEGFDENLAYRLIRLNCKRVIYKREGGTRIGIIATPLARIHGYASDAAMYGRVQPHRLYEFAPNSKLQQQTVFLLKANHLQEFDLAGDDVFFIRSMPKWPPSNIYKLIRVVPKEDWDEKNETFRRARSSVDRPLLLVFRKDSPDNAFYDHFIVAIGREITPLHLQDGWDGGQIWCDAFCRRTGKQEALMLEEDIQQLSRDSKTVRRQVTGSSVKCHVRPEIISGQRVVCVDVLVNPQESPPAAS